MATAYVIHSTSAPSDDVMGAAEAAAGYDTTFKTSKFGPEATDAGDPVDLVVTDDDAVADYWKEKGAEVVRAGVEPLPDWLPKRSQLEAAENVTDLGDVKALARGGVLTDVSGIGSASEEKIIDALAEHSDYDA